EWLDKSIALIKPGVTTDKVCSVWPKAPEFGFPDEMAAFGLQFGHGLGLALHERPIISRVVSLEHPTEIKEGMVFALETYCPATGRLPGRAHGGGGGGHRQGLPRHHAVPGRGAADQPQVLRIPAGPARLPHFPRISLPSTRPRRCVPTCWSTPTIHQERVVNGHSPCQARTAGCGARRAPRRRIDGFARRRAGHAGAARGLRRRRPAVVRPVRPRRPEDHRVHARQAPLPQPALPGRLLSREEEGRALIRQGSGRVRGLPFTPRRRRYRRASRRALLRPYHARARVALNTAWTAPPQKNRQR